MESDTLLNNQTEVSKSIAQTLSEEGSVILMLMINGLGAVDTILIDRRSGYSMSDKAAINAASQWHFVPVIKAVMNRVAQAWVPVRFSLIGRK